MRNLLAATGLVLAAASPALAQTPAQPAAVNNPYAVEAQQILAELNTMPGGGDELTRSDLEFQLQVVKANAYRAGEPIDIAALRHAVATGAAG